LESHSECPCWCFYLEVLILCFALVVSKSDILH
jgi:hypothetical protein